MCESNFTRPVHKATPGLIPLIEGGIIYICSFVFSVAPYPNKQKMFWYTIPGMNNFCQQIYSCQLERLYFQKCDKLLSNSSLTPKVKHMNYLCNFFFFIKKILNFISMTVKEKFWLTALLKNFSKQNPFHWLWKAK